MTHNSSDRWSMRRTRLAWLGIIAVAAAIAVSPVGVAQAPARVMPVFEVDATWPQLPNNWVLGVVSAVSVGPNDHVWILHRPRSVPEELRNRAAPPVLEYDPDGRFVNAWEGPVRGTSGPTTSTGCSSTTRTTSGSRATANAPRRCAAGMTW